MRIKFLTGSLDTRGNRADNPLCGIAGNYRSVRRTGWDALIMKPKTLKCLLIVVLIGIFSHSAFSQTTPAPSAPSAFFNSVQSYFTSFDTNSTTFKNERCEVWTGVDQSPDVLSAIFGLTYNVRTNWSAEAVFENASVAGTILSAQGGGGYRFVKYDAELTLGLDIGYRFADVNATQKRTVFIEPFIDARKALTENTYAGIRLYYQQGFSGDTKAHAPGVFIITGFKF